MSDSEYGHEDIHALTFMQGSYLNVFSMQPLQVHLGGE